MWKVLLSNLFFDFSVESFALKPIIFWLNNKDTNLPPYNFSIDVCKLNKLDCIQHKSNSKKKIYICFLHNLCSGTSPPASAPKLYAFKDRLVLHALQCSSLKKWKKEHFNLYNVWKVWSEASKLNYLIEVSLILRCNRFCNATDSAMLQIHLAACLADGQKEFQAQTYWAYWSW